MNGAKDEIMTMLTIFCQRPSNHSPHSIVVYLNEFTLHKYFQAVLLSVLLKVQMNTHLPKLTLSPEISGKNFFSSNHYIS